MGINMYRYPIITITHPNGNVTQINTNSATIQNLFNENYFRNNLAVSDIEALDQGIANNIYLDTYDFWARVGIKSGLSASPYYNESAYLAYNPDIAALVRGRSINPDSSVVVYDSGQQHWLIKGRDEIINGLRPTAAFAASFTFTTATDNFVAYPYVGGVFTGTDQTFRVGDVADGGTASLSSLVLTLNGGSTGAATITNIGTIDCIVASASGGSVDATNFYDVTAIRSIDSIGTLTIGNLNLNPTIIIDYSSNLTVNYIDAVLSGNNKTFNLNIAAISSANIILNNTNSGFFSTIAINSAGAIADTITSLSGTALVGASMLKINGAQSLTMTVHSSISTIREVIAVPKASITFSDIITGTTGNVLTATFNTAGSSIRFTGLQALATTNVITFTGTGNTLSMTPTMAAAVRSSIGASFTNLDILDINGRLAGGANIVVTNFGSQITTVNLNGLSNLPAPTSGPSAISSLPTGATINLGMTSTAITSLVGALTINGTGSVAVNVLGITPTGAVADTLNITGFTAATLNISTLAIPAGGNTLGFTFSSTSSITTLTVTGGNASSIVAVSFNTLPAAITTFNASACLSPITVTANNAVGVSITGSFTAINTLIGGSNADNISGGTAADTINAKGGINTVTGHGAGIGNTATDVNTYRFTDPTGITTITDCNLGAPNSSVDLIQLQSVLTTPTSNGLIGFLNGNSGNLSGVNVGVTGNNWSGSGALILTATQNIVIVTTTAISTTAQLAAAIGTTNIRTSGGGNWSVANKGIPFVYSDGTNIHISVVQVNTIASAFINAATGKIDEIITLSGIASTANFDTTDFSFIA
jgi:hypothetical protein